MTRRRGFAIEAKSHQKEGNKVIFSYFTYVFIACRAICFIFVKTPRSFFLFPRFLDNQRYKFKQQLYNKLHVYAWLTVLTKLTPRYRKHREIFCRKICQNEASSLLISTERHPGSRASSGGQVESI